jgi:hypothetical protein
MLYRLIVVFLLISRQIVFIVRLCRPVTPNSSPSLPPWLVGRPPTYSEALRGGGGRRGTGDVEDGIIAQNESLPKYGDMSGSTLLARSQSRGGAATGTGGDVGLVAIQERGTDNGAVPFAEVAGSVAIARQPNIDHQREAEARQLEEARRLQAGLERAEVEEPRSQSETVEKAEEKWEDVALGRK